jgi:hypothetical protein
MRVPGNPNAGDFFALWVRCSRREPARTRKVAASMSRTTSTASSGARGSQREPALRHGARPRGPARRGAAIDLDHEPLHGRQEVSDEAAEQRHLATNTGASRRPRMRAYRSASDGVSEARMPRARSSRSATRELLRLRYKGLLSVRVMPTQGAGGVTAPDLLRRQGLGWRGACKGRSRQTKCDVQAPSQPRVSGGGRGECRRSSILSVPSRVSPV